MEETTLLGIGSGGAVGALSAMSLDQNRDKKTMMKSAGVSALIGGVVGYLFHKVIETKKDKVRKETLFNLEAHGIDRGFKPVVNSRYGDFVTSPHVREDYIETHTTDDGRTLVQGHKTWKLIGEPQFNIPMFTRKKK